MIKGPIKPYPAIYMSNNLRTQTRAEGMEHWAWHVWHWLTCSLVAHANDGGCGKWCQRRFLVWWQGDLRGGKGKTSSEGQERGGQRGGGVACEGVAVGHWHVKSSTAMQASHGPECTDLRAHTMLTLQTIRQISYQWLRGKFRTIGQINER